jgi:uncharacterized protein
LPTTGYNDFNLSLSALRALPQKKRTTMDFNATILTVPGLGGSGPEHWQSVWEKTYGFSRIEQKDWDTPACADWVAQINIIVTQKGPGNVVLVGHSLGCAAIAFWAKKFGIQVKGALLVALSDTEAPSFPAGTQGFTPMPLHQLPFPSIAVISNNDDYVSTRRADAFASAWGSKPVNIGAAGHINAGSGLGKWDQGIGLLKQLDAP